MTGNYSQTIKPVSSDIISHTVWLYFRFSLSFRDVEELLAKRGIVVSYETVRQGCLKFGQTYANELQCRCAKGGDTWHRDEVVLTIQRKKHDLWRAVDQAGNLLDIVVQSRRNKKAAKRFFRKRLKGLHYVPRVIITDKLKSYGAGKREIWPGVEHRQHTRLNNRAEHSHQPTRRREKKMRRFKSAKQAQRFLSAFGPISSHFQPRRHRLSAGEYRTILQTRLQVWDEVTRVKPTASPPFSALRSHFLRSSNFFLS